MSVLSLSPEQNVAVNRSPVDDSNKRKSIGQHKRMSSTASMDKGGFKLPDALSLKSGRSKLTQKGGAFGAKKPKHGKESDDSNKLTKP